MKTIKLVGKLGRIQNLTESEKRSTGAAFNNSKAVIGCITDYLGSEIARHRQMMWLHHLQNLLYQNGAPHGNARDLRPGSLVAYMYAQRMQPQVLRHRTTRAPAIRSVGSLFAAC